MAEPALVGGIEFGGTKTNVAIGYQDGKILAQETFPTTEPDALVARLAEFFQSQSVVFGSICSLGVGAFGPIVLKPGNLAYGRLLETNKLGWSNFDLARALRSALGVEAKIVTWAFI
jgi:fructokinase